MSVHTEVVLDNNNKKKNLGSFHPVDSGKDNFPAASTLRIKPEIFLSLVWCSTSQLHPHRMHVCQTDRIKTGQLFPPETMQSAETMAWRRQTRVWGRQHWRQVGNISIKRAAVRPSHATTLSNWRLRYQSETQAGREPNPLWLEVYKLPSLNLFNALPTIKVMLLYFLHLSVHRTHSSVLNLGHMWLLMTGTWWQWLLSCYQHSSGTCLISTTVFKIIKSQVSQSHTKVTCSLHTKCIFILFLFFSSSFFNKLNGTSIQDFKTKMKQLDKFCITISLFPTASWTTVNSVTMQFQRL